MLAAAVSSIVALLWTETNNSWNCKADMLKVRRNHILLLTAAASAIAFAVVRTDAYLLNWWLAPAAVAATLFDICCALFD